MALGASAAATGFVSTAQAATGELTPVRDTRLYVEVMGPPRAPTLLYLHGGPGTGSYDFALIQAARLSRYLRLIMIDQRGVLRSDALEEGQNCGLVDLVEDIEALRATLGIERWSVLGHSFGGYLAAVYAHEYPGSVEKLLFENPTFDFRTTSSFALGLAAAEFQRLGDLASATEAEAASDSPSADDQEMWATFTRLTSRLGTNRMNLYVHGPNKTFFDTLVAESGLDPKYWQRSAAHQRRLFDEGLVFRPRFRELDEITQPALLIRGDYDCVTAPVQAEAFMRQPKRTLARFERSAHFARFEEPERYAETVIGFVTHAGQ